MILKFKFQNIKNQDVCQINCCFDKENLEVTLSFDGNEPLEEQRKIILDKSNNKETEYFEYIPEEKPEETVIYERGTQTNKEVSGKDEQETIQVAKKIIKEIIGDSEKNEASEKMVGYIFPRKKGKDFDVLLYILRNNIIDWKVVRNCRTDCTSAVQQYISKCLKRKLSMQPISFFKLFKEVLKEQTNKTIFNKYYDELEVEKIKEKINHNIKDEKSKNVINSIFIPLAQDKPFLEERIKRELEKYVQARMDLSRFLREDLGEMVDVFEFLKYLSTKE